MEDALNDFRNEVHSKYLTEADRSAYPQIQHISTHVEGGHSEPDGYKSERGFDRHGRKRGRKRNRTKKGLDTSHLSEGKAEEWVDTSHHHRSSKSRKAHAEAVLSTIKKKSSKRGKPYDKNTDSDEPIEEIQIAPDLNAYKSGRKSIEPKRSSGASVRTPEKGKTYIIREEQKSPFTFARRDKEQREEVNMLYEKMRDFESQMMTMFRNLQADFDNTSRRLEDKITKLESNNDNNSFIKSELEYLKGLSEALEEERKKDLSRNKQFVEGTCQDLYNDIENQRETDKKELDKKLQKQQFEQTEQLIECTDNTKRELKDIKYSIDKNSEDIELLQKIVKALKRRNEEAVKEKHTIKKDESQITEATERKMEEKFDSKLQNLYERVKNEFKEECEEHITYNNNNFVVPTIEHQVAEIAEKVENQQELKQEHSVEKSKEEPRASLPHSMTFDSRNIEEKCEKILQKKLEPECKKIIKREVPQICQEIVDKQTPKICGVMIEDQTPTICKKIVEDEVELTCRQLMDSEIEPVCRRVMLEEYARTRRSIIEKEIEPTCREIIEEEVPAICETMYPQQYSQAPAQVEKEDLRPICKEIIDEEVQSTVQKSVRQELEISKYEVLQSKIEPICRQIVHQEVVNKCKECIDEDVEEICRNAVRDELETWAKVEQEERRKSHSSPPVTKTYKSRAKSAKQLPKRFTKIDESAEEDSPAALPDHNLPPESFIDGRSSVMQSEISNLDAYSMDDRNYRFSADPPISFSRLLPKDKRVHLLRESKQDKLRDYLRDKFRPPSDSRSAEKRSTRSYRHSRDYDTPGYKAELGINPTSFGISNVKRDSSLSRFKSSPNIERKSYDEYSFLGGATRARHIMNKMDSDPKVATDLKSRSNYDKKTFANTNEEFKISSTPMLDISHRLGDDDRTESSKYMKNVKLSQSNFMDIQDVIRENNRQRSKDKL